MEKRMLAILRAINGAFPDLTGEVPLADSLAKLVARIVEVLEVDHATITLLEERGQFFRIATEHPPSSPSLVGERITIAGRPVQLKLFHSKEPVIVPVVECHPIYAESTPFQKMAERLGIQSMLILPIILGESTIGTISLDSIGRRRSFSPGDIELCRAIANQAAVAVAHTRLQDQQAKYRRQAELLLPPPIRSETLAVTERAARQVLRGLESVVAFKKASIQLVTDRKRTLLAAYGFSRQNPEPWLLRPVDSDPIIREIADGRKIVVLSDTSSAEGWEKQPATSDVNSWIGIPLVFQGATIGLVTLDHDEPGFYGRLPQDVRTRLEDQANVAAGRIHDAYELDMAQGQIRALEAISAVTERIATALHRDELLPAITVAIVNCLGCTRCNLFFVDKQTQRLECRAVWPEPHSVVSPFEAPSCHPPEELQSPILRAFYTQSAVFVADLLEAGAFDTSHELFRNARSLIVVPLKVADQTIGAVSAIHEEPNWFSTADQLLLETLTRHAGIAIERAAGLEAIHSIGKDILQASIGNVLEQIVTNAMQVTHTDSGVIYLLNDDRTEVTQHFKTLGSIHPRPRLENPNGITRRVLREKRMVELPDIREDPDVNPDLLPQYRSMVAVPLMLEGAVVGILYLNGNSVRRLSHTERSLLFTLADQAALAIQRTRLYQQLRAFQSLVDNIPQCVVRKDLESRFVSANASFCRSVNASLEEIIGKTDRDFYPGDKAEKYVHDDKCVMQFRNTIELDEEHQLLGSEKTAWVRVVKTPVLDEDKVVGVQAIFWDVTEQRQIAERWRSLVEQSPDSIVIHEDGRITLANPAAVRLLEVENAEALKGRSILEFIDESSRDLAAERLQKLVRKESVQPMVEMKVKKQTGVTVDVEVYARPGPGMDEVQVVFHDLTRTRTLLREMHHRVRRSLNQIRALLPSQEQQEANPRVRRVFQAVSERIQAMALVHTVLHDTGQESQVSMVRYLRAVVDAVFDAYGASGGRILRSVCVDDIELDEKRATACGLIVTELVANSLLHAFGGHRGSVSVSLTACDGRLSLVVSDTGRGMKAGCDKSMGLLLVETLVQDSLKGTIRQDCQFGTEFTIAFPR